MQFYTKNLLPVLQELDEERKKALKYTGVAGAIICVAVGIISFLIFRRMSALDGGEIFLYFLFSVAIMLACCYGAFAILSGDYKRNFKNRVIAAIVGFISPQLRYDMDGTVSRASFVNSRIFTTRVDRYRGEDYVRGMVDKTKIEFSEIHAEEKRVTRDSKGRTRTRYITIFKGLFFIADFNKNFNGLTVVLPDFAEKTFGSLIGNVMQKMNVTRKGELVKLEDPEFQKSFVVYGDDQIEARYILTPALMRRILDFKKKFNNKIYLSFLHNKVHLAIETGKDMFEPPYLKSTVDFRLAKEYYEDFIFAVGIVDELNLNTRIWTRE